MKHIVLFSGMFLLGTVAYGQDVEPAQEAQAQKTEAGKKFQEGKKYLVKSWIEDKSGRKCSDGWTEIEVLGYSERGDIMEVKRTADSATIWAMPESICDSQKSRK